MTVPPASNQLVPPGLSGVCALACHGAKDAPGLSLNVVAGTDGKAIISRTDTPGVGWTQDIYIRQKPTPCSIM